tara:strand:- start:478 stop:1095 length:618 start_codon:yes stop_codon:yes gene_type:complete
MVKVVISDAKGLVQSSGNGVQVTSVAQFDEAVNLKGTNVITGPTTFSSINGLKGARQFREFGHGNHAAPDIAAGALTVNRYYKSIAAATAMTIPSAAAGNIGDFITIYYGVAIGNGNAHTFTTTVDTAFALGSVATRIGGGVASKADISVAADNILTITGHTNGDGGLGTTVQLVNTSGAAQGWAIKAVTTNQGTGAQAGTLAFS